jgi:hypothetical protein
MGVYDRGCETGMKFKVGFWVGLGSLYEGGAAAFRRRITVMNGLGAKLQQRALASACSTEHSMATFQSPPNPKSQREAGLQRVLLGHIACNIALPSLA